MAAGATALSILKSKPEIYETLENAGDRIADELNDFCLGEGIDGQVSRCSSMFRFIFTSKNVTDRRSRDTLEASEAVQRRFYTTLEENGLSTGTNRINFLSTSHDASVLERVIVAFKKTIEKVLLTPEKKALELSVRADGSRDFIFRRDESNRLHFVGILTAYTIAMTILGINL